MKAVIKEKKGYNSITYKDIPKPIINDDEVLIKVKAAGICGSDIHIFHDEHPYWPPVVLGHEFSGVIEKVGKNIINFKVGDRVTSENHLRVCGICRFCRLGLIHLCSSRRAAGYGIDGAMADFIKLPELLLHKLPEGISFIEGAIIEPTSTVTHAIIERGKIGPQEIVVVIGPGPIGLIAAQVAKACGVKKVVICGITEDMNHRLSVAKELNIDFIVNVDETDLRKLILSQTNKYGADSVVECSGSESGVNLAVDILAKNGKLIGMGLFGKDLLKFKWDQIIYKELNIIPSMSSTFSSWNYAISMLDNGKLNLKKIVSHTIPMSQYRKAFELLMNKKGLKIILIPDKEYQNNKIES